VVSISLKDRAAILMGGRMADAAIWFDDSTGRWISSRFYCPSGRLPGWVEELNALRVPDAWFGKRWVPLVPEGGSGSPGLVAVSSSLAAIRLGRSFPHPVDGGLSAPGPAFYKAFALTPWANEFVFRTARQAVVSERLGQDETPDLLTVNLSSNDYIGHSFGPDSPEALDCLLRTDRELSAFFRYLASTVPGGLDRLLVALASDHGVDPVPEEMRAAGFPSTRVQESDLERRVDAALDTCFGPQDWVLAFADFNLYLNPDALAASDCGPEQIRRMAARTLSTTSGIYGAFTRNQIEEGRLPDTNPSRRLYGAYHPKRSGDVLVITDPFCFTEESPLKHLTTHGSPYAYNTSVPLLLTGPGIRPGVYADPVSPADLTPTLALLLGICPPSASDGIPLKSALR
jgi:predicted AlkP superfamily pyrophosphatase or phosphodiesterase